MKLGVGGLEIWFENLNWVGKLFTSYFILFLCGTLVRTRTCKLPLCCFRCYSFYDVCLHETITGWLVETVGTHLMNRQKSTDIISYILVVFPSGDTKWNPPDHNENFNVHRHPPNRWSWRSFPENFCCFFKFINFSMSMSDKHAAIIIPNMI